MFTRKRPRVQRTDSSYAKNISTFAWTTAPFTYIQDSGDRYTDAVLNLVENARTFNTVDFVFTPAALPDTYKVYGGCLVVDGDGKKDIEFDITVSDETSELKNHNKVLPIVVSKTTSIHGRPLGVVFNLDTIFDGLAYEQEKVYTVRISPVTEEIAQYSKPVVLTIRPNLFVAEPEPSVFEDA